MASIESRHPLSFLFHKVFFVSLYDPCDENESREYVGGGEVRPRADPPPPQGEEEGKAGENNQGEEEQEEAGEEESVAKLDLKKKSKY